ncbi:hypothetical protein SLEP1_g47835 [Rubroshorea leprosula]|uniref:Reverse transcriptase domain-containing protein n=1 Tax=Rubroshorea leprosula TaxID=152421 RepID=A0AAV5LUP8_9ROSI|nr:hypothetical protein SLEP1_g47835 [Rubroshorea leprosula]
METKLAGEKAKEIAASLRFLRASIVDANGLAEGIWLLWDDTRFQVNELNERAQVIHAMVKGPWLVIGDFNDITCQDEKLGGNIVPQYRIRAYVDCMNYCDLLDLGYSGPKFTWVNKRESNQLIRERLDRAWVNPSWRMLFPEASLRHLPRLHSDHCPILLQLDPVVPRHGDKPFRLEKFWLDHESFKDLVLKDWSNPYLSFYLCSVAFKDSCISWSKATFPNFHKKKRELLAQLDGIQRTLQHGNNPFLLNLEDILSKEYQTILKYEEDLWFMKSRVQWIQKGDKNSKFFHVSTIKRRSHNRILGLKDLNGNWCFDAKDINSLITSHFRNLYNSSHVQSFDDSYMDILNGPSILSSSWHHLSNIPSQREVWTALNTMQPFKAPGPDGLHVGFFLKYWEFLKEKLCYEISNIFSSASMTSSWNSSLLALIPKVNKPESVSQFRPIGLCNISYKIVTKIIVLRLKPIMDSLVSPMQASFIPGRNGVDNVTLLREFIYSFSRKKGRQGEMIIKLDLEKAYDCLEWSFVRETLIFFNFPPNLIALIMSCISSANMACIVNGDVQNGHWKGAKLGRSGPIISHLFFADDLIFIGKASIANASHLKNLLSFFCSRSRQNINQSKSKILFSKNTDDLTKFNICHTLGFAETNSFGKYLGIPITPKKVSKKDCSFIVDKVRGKLAAVYLPSSIHDELDKISRDFIWGSTDEKKKAHLVSWERITQPKRNGGIGIKSAKEANQASMAKLQWRLAADKGNLWAKALKQKYKIEGPRHDFSNSPSPVCKDMAKGSHIFGLGISWIPRNGNDTYFWQDRWCGSKPLNSVLYGPFKPTDCHLKVADILTPQGTWDLDKISYHLPSDIVACIQAIPLSKHTTEDDKFVWNSSANGTFSMNFAYNIAKGLPICQKDQWYWI